jgi:hypothetical protein
VTIPRYVAGGELAPTRLWLTANGSLVDLSTGFTITAILARGVNVVLTKTTGIAGAEGAGIEPSGTPNCVISWAANQLELDPARYTLQVQARNGAGLDYRWTLPFNIDVGYDPPA